MTDATKSLGVRTAGQNLAMDGEDENPSQLSSTSTVVAVGNFDGLHLGHRDLVLAALERARKTGLEALAVTFDPHPRKVLTPESAPSTLMTLEQRSELLRSMGVLRVVVVPFTHEFAGLAPEQFADQVLRSKLGARWVVVGEAFRFGRDRSGDVPLLRRAGESLGFSVEARPAIRHSGKAISSSRIRESLRLGDLSSAEAMLGRRFFVDGEVVAGEHRGRRLGFPTANVATVNETLPAEGVYAVRTRLERRAEWRAGVANLGRRPTFGGGQLALEVHLLDFDGDIYGSQLRVEFVKGLRAERPFASVEELVDQLRRDVAVARALLEQDG